MPYCSTSSSHPGRGVRSRRSMSTSVRSVEAPHGAEAAAGNHGCTHGAGGTPPTPVIARTVPVAGAVVVAALARLTTVLCIAAPVIEAVLAVFVEIMAAVAVA